MLRALEQIRRMRRAVSPDALRRRLLPHREVPKSYL